MLSDFDVKDKREGNTRHRRSNAHLRIFFLFFPHRFGLLACTILFTHHMANKLASGQALHALHLYKGGFFRKVFNHNYCFLTIGFGTWSSKTSIAEHCVVDVVTLLWMMSAQLVQAVLSREMGSYQSTNNN